MFRNGSSPTATSRRRLLAVAAAALVGVGAVAGTATASSPPADIDPDASVAIGFVLEPTNLDILHTAGAALDQVLLDNIYETLVKASPEGEITPGVTTLDISDDGLTYTLTIQDGVVFSDGTPLTSADIVWSLTQFGAPSGEPAGFASATRSVPASSSPASSAPASTEPAGSEPATASTAPAGSEAPGTTAATDEGTEPAAGTEAPAGSEAPAGTEAAEPAPTGIRAGDFTSVESVEAVDDSTIVLHLSQRDNDLAWNLSRRGGAVLKADATDLENTAVGTGPFTLAAWNQGSSITLARNDSYWGEAPQVSEVVFQYFTEPTAATAALDGGDVDLITGVSADLAPQYQDNPDWVVSVGTTNGEVTLGINNRTEALSNPLVREAITQAIDLEGVLALANGYGTVIHMPVAPTDPWYEDLSDLYPYDPEAARAKLEEAGYGDGLELTFIVPNFYPTATPEFVVSQLADVGITVDLQVVEFSAWLEQVYTNHDFDLSYVIHVEPRDLENYANPDYYFGYDNADVQQLLADARVAESTEEQIDLTRQAAVQVATDAASVWLLNFADIIVSRPGVSGFPTFDVQSRFDASDIVVEAG